MPVLSHSKAAVSSRPGSRGRCCLLLVLSPHSCISNSFSLGQCCCVNTNKTKLLLLKKKRKINPLQRRISLCRWALPHILFILLIFPSALTTSSRFTLIRWSLKLCSFLSCNQEDLIQCTEPDSLQVTTKDMDSTLSKASRAIKKTSKKVIVCSFDYKVSTAHICWAASLCSG